MNELPYKMEHLQEYKGILTSRDARNGNFKMELIVKDNPVLKRSVEKIESSIELEFHYNFGTSTLFFHNVTSCPKSRQDEKCPECKNIIAIFDKFTANLYYLQIGDTFKISVLPSVFRPLSKTRLCYNNNLFERSIRWPNEDDLPLNLKRKLCLKLLAVKVHKRKCADDLTSAKSVLPSEIQTTL